ncbi:MAG: hypothetical protein EA341_10375 [Mongoliibacter sp.]|uniref:hypothetical protein n=1 Tax=Mongoliibacter sp. TaxID=2022438 RepID=UPI0012F358A1|nr:hypothetical protein [Mongoliibacter sp.]TVP48802.1 MAG: hypothetical protein EA341_10375 [Mongoliibacter sp.]
MAKTEKNFDQYFREKLESHQEKPSSLAWERLESQLPKKKKAGFYPLLRIAAAIVLLLSAGIVLLKWSGDDQDTPQQVAELTTLKEEGISKNQENDESVISETSPNQKEDNSETVTAKEPKPDVIQKQPIRPTTTPFKDPALGKTMAEAIAPREENKIVEMELPEITLPELKITEAVAMNQAVEEEPAYKVIIKSRGLKEEAPKQGLIGEIEEKVEKIEGLWNKIGQGYADLQDAKENLFANNSPRKERSK